MSRKSRGKAVIDGEEVVDMKQGDDGKYFPVAIVKVQEQEIAREDVMRELPRHFGTMYEIVNGFVMGLGAVTNFMENVRKMNGRGKR